MQTVVVVIIVAIAVIYLFRRFMRLFGKSETSGCGCGCSGCMTAKSDDCGLPDRQGEDGLGEG